jgi:hypothetical protein
LERAGNKLRIKGNRLFVATTGLELLPHHLPGGNAELDGSRTDVTGTPLLFDGIKLVLSKSKDYEAPKAVMSPLTGPIFGEGKRSGPDIEHKRSIGKILFLISLLSL